MVRRRANVNRARAKAWEREVPADAGLIRLYSDYLHEEYGPLDCDFVLSGCRDNTNCPESGIIWRRLLRRWSSAWRLFRGGR
jgi:hypothetical protein